MKGSEYFLKYIFVFIWCDFTSLFFFSSFVPLGSSGFAERTRPGQSTTETLRMHYRVFSSTLQRLREKLMLTVHGYSCTPLVPHQRLSAQVATVCVLFHTNWAHGWNGGNTSHECTLHQLGVAMWVCEALNYFMSLSAIFTFTFSLWLYPFVSLTLDMAFLFKRNKVIYIFCCGFWDCFYLFA